MDVVGIVAVCFDCVVVVGMTIKLVQISYFVRSREKRLCHSSVAFIWKKCRSDFWH
jgi:hypothetical protein